MTTLALFLGSRSAVEVARISARAIDAPLVATAELWVSTLESEAVLFGAFQRSGDADVSSRPRYRRASGGPSLAIGPGVVHVALALAHPAALTACDAPRIVNRYVRPLLRALATFGEKTAYFGRDWVSVQHRPVAWVGFAHDATTKRAVFEAVIGGSTTWSLDRNRASFLDKSEITLSDAIGHECADDAIAAAIVDAYRDAYSGEELTAPALALPFAVEDEPPWSATRDEAIGIVAAGRDRTGALRVGGQFLASRDAVARLEAKIAAFDASTDERTLGQAVDSALAAPGVALHGIKSLTSVRDVIADSLRI